MKAKRRNFGWLHTISALEEKSFPLFIKNISIKQLFIIFPLALATIYVIHYNIMYAFVTLGPIMFIILYEERSLGPFEYAVYFLLSMVSVSPSKPNRSPTPRPIDLTKIKQKKVDVLQLSVATALAYLSFYESTLFVQHSQIPNLMMAILSGSIASALFVSELLIFNIKRRKSS